ncbi:uncharacterized protein [Watersipora subatra]|uniref:uncharacterized protein n=1 Tax=Watersipora subatra TaxID=2589382 RepID=UPI00355C42AF
MASGYQFLAPKPLAEVDLPAEWEACKKDFTHLLAAIDKDKADDKVKIALLLRTIGERRKDIYKTFTYATGKSKNVFADVLENFDSFCKPRRSLFNSRDHFLNCKQNHATIDEYLTELKKRARHCEFGERTETQCDSLFVECVNSSQPNPTDWTTDIEINNTTVSMLLDTGAEGNTLPVQIVSQMNLPVQLCSTTLYSYSGDHLVPSGQVTATARINDKSLLLKFMVVPEGRRAVLGGETCVNLGLLAKLNQIYSTTSKTDSNNHLKDYSDVFDGLGCIEAEYSIKINTIYTPVVHAPRVIPEPVQDKVIEELRQIESQSIIVKVTEPTDWVNSLVLVKKPDGSIRICIDPTIAAIERLLESLDGAAVIMNSILIYAETLEEHIKRLKANRVKPDSCNVSVIHNLEPPTDKKEVQRIIGMVNYLTKFVPNLCEHLGELRMMTEKVSGFIWTQQQDKNFRKIKDAISSTPVLKYYDVTIPVLITADSKKSTIGAAILQDGRPVAYASKALKSTEKDWFQIEKEIGFIEYWKLNNTTSSTVTARVKSIFARQGISLKVKNKNTSAFPRGSKENKSTLTRHICWSPSSKELKGLKGARDLTPLRPGDHIRKDFDIRTHISMDIPNELEESQPSTAHVNGGDIGHNSDTVPACSNPNTAATPAQPARKRDVLKLSTLCTLVLVS